jgi:small nuclear ribonucleoprotein (snRNP)-like protein
MQFSRCRSHSIYHVGLSSSACPDVVCVRNWQVTGRPVVVKLNTGVDYRGVLACLDGYMNIAMEQVCFLHNAS